MINETNRYSDQDLSEFRLLVESRLKKTRNQLQQLQLQLAETHETPNLASNQTNNNNNKNSKERNVLRSMVVHYQKYLISLEDALVRIENRTYGICILTGELMDKKRLLATPTVTVCFLAKNHLAKRPVELNQPHAVSRGERLVVTQESLPVKEVVWVPFLEDQ